jgi:flagellar basal-body rod protein FlgB
MECLTMMASINRLFNDDGLHAARLALDGLSIRQQVISRNLANVDTPGYRSQMVDFETTIRRALDQDTGVRLERTSAGHMSGPAGSMNLRVTNRPGGILRADQNNVDIDTELVQMSETGIQYQAISQEISKRLQLLKAIAQDR